MADPLGVSIAFDATPFTVTPTWTRIDTYTGIHVQEWMIDRGRPNEFSKTGTGTAVIRGVDLTGVLDPTNTGGTFYGKIEPNKQVAIALRDPVLDTWHTLFRGFVENWSFDLHLSERLISFEIQCVDGFGVFAKHELQPGLDGSALPDSVEDGNVFYAATSPPDGVGDRLREILEDVGWDTTAGTSLTSIYSGNVTLQSKVYGPATPALAALEEAVDGEFPGVANHFMTSGGTYAFRGRQPRFRPDVAAYGINERDVGDMSAGTSSALVSALQWDRGTANIYNAVLITPQGVDPSAGTTYATDLTSVGTYGRNSLTLENLLTYTGIATGNTALQECQLIRDYYLANYKDVHNRISRMTFRPRAANDPYAPALWRMICRAEISDKLNLSTSHVGGGGFNEAFYVEGIHYQAHPGGTAIHDITLDVDVSPASLYGTNPFAEDIDPV